MKAFKIQRTIDGMFSASGTSPRFTKRGKVWSALSHVTSHLRYVKQSDMHDLILVEYEINEDGTSSLVTKTPLIEISVAANERRAIREAKLRIARDAQKLVYLQSQQARLQNESLKNIQEMDRLMRVDKKC